MKVVENDIIPFKGFLAINSSASLSSGGMRGGRRMLGTGGSVLSTRVSIPPR
jgi:hypothetical protein